MPTELNLTLEDIASADRVLQAAELLDTEEKVLELSRPGSGNMNLLARVTSSRGRSWIVKQARDYVEKYPQIKAPRVRAVSEATFYRVIQQDVLLRRMMPEFLYIDEENAILVIGDLGRARDLTLLYGQGETIQPKQLEQLLTFLNRLHHDTAFAAVGMFTNRAMRELNAEHLFRFPFRTENGMDLDKVTPGLQRIAGQWRDNVAVVQAAETLEVHYLSDGPTLLHGDYYPGSWLETEDGVRIIDPEFSFAGPAEFDLGVLRAHLIMANQPSSVLAEVESQYSPPASFSQELCDRFTGLEIFRRLIGIAQLPLALGLAEKQALLCRAAELLTT